MWFWITSRWNFWLLTYKFWCRKYLAHIYPFTFQTFFVEIVVLKIIIYIFMQFFFLDLLVSIFYYFKLYTYLVFVILWILLLKWDDFTIWYFSGNVLLLLKYIYKIIFVLHLNIFLVHLLRQAMLFFHIFYKAFYVLTKMFFCLLNPLWINIFLLQ